MIDLDHNATTRPSPAVIQAVTRALAEFWHNPSSVHRAGQAARHQVELARKEAAALIGVSAREIVFTSGGTEAIDLAIRGVVGARAAQIAPGGERSGTSSKPTPPVIVSTRVEHSAVRDLLEDLEKCGAAQVRRAPIDREGIVDSSALAPLLAGAALCTIQWANNETGAVQPVDAIGETCRGCGVVFHCDGTQWIGKEETKRSRDEETKPSHPPLPCDILTFSPHKFHGPKGIGVLWARRGLGLRPTIHGTQELGRRGGTENVPGILGAGVACREAREWLARPGERRRLAGLRDRFESLVLAAVPDALVNGPRDPARRLWNTTNIGFPRLEAEALLLMLSERGVNASAGAACSSGSLDPSPVLLAMGVPREVAHGSLRFSLSKDTTEAEIIEAARLVAESVAALRASLGAA
ncbi:MAG: cysteine desulfurase family protein [Phycisphaerales bacterium]